jgi:hypothetical protein
VNSPNDLKSRLKRKLPWLVKLAQMRYPIYWTPMREKFTKIYHENHWSGVESRSGGGSDLQATVVIRPALSALFKRLQIKSLLDLPCGDFLWMKEVDLQGIDYTGGDIVPELIASNQAKYGAPGRKFIEIDITATVPPRADLILVRDCLVHFSYRDLRKALVNIKASGAEWLLTTTFPHRAENEDIVTGFWRPVNLQIPPFSLPPPLELINEHSPGKTPESGDKSLGLWKLSELVI